MGGAAFCYLYCNLIWVCLVCLTVIVFCFLFFLLFHEIVGMVVSLVDLNEN